MSHENVEIVRSMYAAFAKGEIPTIIAALHPQVEWWEAENFIYDDGNPYIGHNAVLTGVFARIGAEWEGFAVSPKEVLDAGETIIGHGYYSGTYRKNGKQARAQFALCLVLSAIAIPVAATKKHKRKPKWPNLTTINVGLFQTVQTYLKS